MVCCEEINNGQILELIETQLEQGGKEEKEGAEFRFFPPSR